MSDAELQALAALLQFHTTRQQVVNAVRSQSDLEPLLPDEEVYHLAARIEDEMERRDQGVSIDEWVTMKRGAKCGSEPTASKTS